MILFPPRSFLVACLVFGLAAFLARPADAVPIRYTFAATLSLSSGDDSGLQLDGATLTITVDADSSASPTSSISSGNSWLSYYPVTATAVFSGRPNAAPDETVVYTPNLMVTNRFPPTTGSDLFGIQSSFASFSTETIFMPGISLDFTDSAFLPGTDPSPLPLFDPSDVASFSAAQLHRQPTSPYYDLENVSITAVPEPTTLALLLIGMLGLAAKPR